MESVHSNREESWIRRRRGKSPVPPISESATSAGVVAVSSMTPRSCSRGVANGKVGRVGRCGATSEEVAEGDVEVEGPLLRGPDVDAEQELSVVDAEAAARTRVQVEEVAVVPLQLPDTAGVHEADQPEGDHPFEKSHVGEAHAQFGRGEGLGPADVAVLGQAAHAPLASHAFDGVRAAEAGKLEDRGSGGEDV